MKNDSCEHEEQMRAFLSLEAKSISRLCTVVIGLLLVISTVIIVGTEVLNHKNKVRNQHTEIHLKFLDLSLVAQMMRFSEESFFTKKESQWAKFSILKADELLDRIASLRKHKKIDDYSIPLQQLEIATKTFKQKFEATVLSYDVLGLSPSKGLLGDVHKYGTQLEILAKDSVKNYRLQVYVLQMRNAEKDFLLTGKQGYMVDHNAANKRALEYIANSKVGESVKINFRSVLNKYTSKMDRLVKVVSSLKDEQEPLNQAYIEIEKLLDHLREQSKVKPTDFNEFLSDWRLLISALALLTILVSGLYGIVILRRAARYRR